MSELSSKILICMINNLLVGPLSVFKLADSNHRSLSNELFDFIIFDYCCCSNVKESCHYTFRLLSSSPTCVSSFRGILFSTAKWSWMFWNLLHVNYTNRLFQCKFSQQQTHAHAICCDYLLIGRILLVIRKWSDSYIRWNASYMFSSHLLCLNIMCLHSNDFFAGRHKCTWALRCSTGRTKSRDSGSL